MIILMGIEYLVKSTVKKVNTLKQKIRLKFGLS